MSLGQGRARARARAEQSRGDRCAPTSPLSRWEGTRTRRGAPSIDPPRRDPPTRGELDIGSNRTENRRDDTEQFEQWRPPPPATAFQPVLPATVYAFIRNTLRPENYPWIWIDWTGVCVRLTDSQSHYINNLTSLIKYPGGLLSTAKVGCTGIYGQTLPPPPSFRAIT